MPYDEKKTNTFCEWLMLIPYWAPEKEINILPNTCLTDNDANNIAFVI